MTEANKPDDAVHTGESTEDSSNFQPTIDAHQASASERLLATPPLTKISSTARCSKVRRVITGSATWVT